MKIKKLTGNDLYNLADKMNNYARDLSGRVRVECVANDIVFFNRATDEIVDYYLQGDGQSAASFKAGAFDAVDNVSAKIAAAKEMESTKPALNGRIFRSDAEIEAEGFDRDDAAAAMEKEIVESRPADHPAAIHKPTIEEIVAWYSPADLLDLTIDRFAKIHDIHGTSKAANLRAAFLDIEGRLHARTKTKIEAAKLADLAADVAKLKERTREVATAIASGVEGRGKSIDFLAAALRNWRQSLAQIDAAASLHDKATGEMSIDAFPYFEFEVAVNAYADLHGSNDRPVVDLRTVFDAFQAARPFDRKGRDADPEPCPVCSVPQRWDPTVDGFVCVNENCDETEPGDPFDHASVTFHN